MAYQQGSQSITNGFNTVTVTFPVAMDDIPSLVMVNVENTTDTPPLQHLDPIVKTKSTSGFVVELNAAATSGNYKLVWFAGSPNQEYQGVSSSGVKVTKVPRRNAAPGANDLFMMVDMSNGAPATVASPWSYIASVFGKMTSVPAGPTSPGVAGNWAMDSSYFYSHDGATWGRTPRVISDWELPTENEFVQEGTVELEDEQTVVEVTFPNEYDEAPNVGFYFENTSTAASKQILNGLVSDRTVSGFTVLLNTAVEGNNYRMNWRATGTPT